MDNLQFLVLIIITLTINDIKTVCLAVTLSGNDNSQFRGFFVQARKPNDNTASYRTFAVIGNDSDAQTLNCFTQTNVS